MLIEISIITFILSTFFSLGGIGSATALILAMSMLGFSFNKKRNSRKFIGR